MNERKTLSDFLLMNSDRENLFRAWKQTTAAGEFAPLPPGEYLFRILTGELFTSKRGTAGFKLALEVTEGEHEGRRAWHDLWLTPAALPMTKRDLAKIGVTELEQLERPLPPGILIRGKLTIRRDDDGNEGNRLVRFAFAGIEAGDAFEPAAEADDQGAAALDTSFAPIADEPSPDAAPAPDANGAPPAGANGTAPPPKPSQSTVGATATEGGAGR